MTDVNTSQLTNSSFNETFYGYEPISASAFEIAIVAFFGLFALLGIVINILTIIVFVRGTRSSIRDIRVLMINRAVINLLFAISGPVPLALRNYGVSFPDSEELCRFWQFTYEISAYGSPLANLGIAIERLVIVYSTARTLRLRNRKVVMYIIIGCFWAFKIAITADFFVFSKLTSFGPQTTCDHNHWIHKIDSILYNTLLIVKFAVPSILIMILYGIIALKMTVLSGTIGNIALEPQLMRRVTQQKKMVKMLTIVAIITLVAYLPYNLYTISYQYEDPLDNNYRVSYYLEITLFGLQLTNGFSSPIVYMVFDRYFKRDLRDMFGCCAFVSRSATSQPTQTTTTARTVRGNGGNAAVAGGSNANRSIATVIEPETTTVPDIRPKKSKKKKASERTWLKATKSRTSNA